MGFNSGFKGLINTCISFTAVSLGEEIKENTVANTHKNMYGKSENHRIS